MITTMAAPQQNTFPSKHTRAVGPFPRYVWIHQDTPPDSLDKTCYEIWRKVQYLPVDMKPKKEKRSFLKEAEVKEWSVDGGMEKDEIHHMVEQEYINLIIEEFNGLSLDLKNHKDIKTMPVSVNDAQTPVKHKMKAMMNGTDSMSSEREQRPAADHKFTKAKGKLIKKGATTIALSIAEVHNLKKFIATKIYPNAKIILDKTRPTKSFKRNNTFCSYRSADKLANLPEAKKGTFKQIPEFAKSCSKGSNSEQNQHSETTSKDAEGLAALADSGSENRDVDPTQAENKDKILVHKPRFKALEGNAEGKIEPPSDVKGTVTSKTIVPYTSHPVTSHETSLPATSLNRPYQLNYLSSFGILPTCGPHYQALFQHRPQVPFAPNQNSQLEYFFRQIGHFNLYQAAQPLFSALYNPMMNYMYCTQYQPWNIPRLTNKKDLGPMGGDAPQNLFPNMHRLHFPINRAMINNPYFSSGGNGKKPS